MCVETSTERQDGIPVFARNVGRRVSFSFFQIGSREVRQWIALSGHTDLMLMIRPPSWRKRPAKYKFLAKGAPP